MTPLELVIIGAACFIGGLNLLVLYRLLASRTKEIEQLLARVMLGERDINHLEARLDLQVNAVGDLFQQFETHYTKHTRLNQELDQIHTIIEPPPDEKYNPLTEGE